MGFLTRIIALLLAILNTFFPFLGGSDDESNIVTVDGVVYRNLFMGDLALKREALELSDKPAYEKRSLTLYWIETEEYDLLYNISGTVIGSSDRVYCREDEWEELNAYCTNTDNFDFFCVFTTNETNSCKLDGLDVEKYNQLVAFADGNEFDPFDLTYNNNTVEISYDIWYTPRYSFVAETKNGLFYSNAYGLYVWEGKLVKLHHTVGGGETGKAYIVYAPDELSGYFVDVINKLNIQ